MNIRLAIPTLSVLLGLAAFPACSSSSDAEAGPKKLCTPGNEYYCKCTGQGEGQRVCNEDGMSFGACEPCDEEIIEPEVDGGVVECGDGIVQNGEECDDKNDDDDDGCSAQCRLSGADPAATRSCPGLDVHVWEDPVEYSGTTAGAPNSARGTPGCPSTTDPGVTGSTAADRIFRVTAHKAGTMTVGCRKNKLRIPYRR